MGIEVTGEIHVIGETKQVSDKFRKREFVLSISDNPKYPQHVQFQLTNDRCEQLDGYEEGDRVRIDFSLRGREWRSPSGEVKYFNTLDVWKIEALEQRQTRRGGGGSGRDAAPPANDPDQDIPFASCELAHEPSPIAKVLRRI